MHDEIELANEDIANLSKTESNQKKTAVPEMPSGQSLLKQKHQHQAVQNLQLISFLFKKPLYITIS
jgi:hypothetical protein